MKKDLNLILSLPSGCYRIQRLNLNRNFGSTFDAWQSMAALEQIQPNIYNYLKSKEIPEMKITSQRCAVYFA